MPSVDLRYSTNLIIPDSSDVKDNIANQELNYVFKALQALALRIDEVSGALSPLQTDWSQLSPTDTVLISNLSKFYCVAGAAITFGQIINLYQLDATHVAARPAIANSISSVASGYCLSPGGVAAGQYGEFIIGPGLHYGFAGLVPGNWYYLSPTSPGLVTATAPSTAGQVYQNLGQAITDRIIMMGSFNDWLLL